MNANQAQAGINRLLQLGETTTPAARVERSVSENSFDQHMKQAATQEPRPRNEPDQSRREVRDTQAPTGRETDQGLSRSKPSKEGSPETKGQSELSDQGGKEALNPASDDSDKTAIEEGDILVHNDERVTATELGESVGFKEEALLDSASNNGLLTHTEELPSADVLNGGALGGEVNSMTPDLLAEAKPLLAEAKPLLAEAKPLVAALTSSAQVGEALAEAGKALPVAPTQLSESAAMSIASTSQPKVALGLREAVATPIGVTHATPATTTEEAAEQPLMVDPTLTSDTKTAAKTTIANMALMGDQSSSSKSAATMTPQADQWFKQLAAEPPGPELRSAQASPVSAGSAVADMAKAQSRIASSMVSQGTMGPLQTQVKTPFGSTQWGGAVAERVAFLASQRVSAAEIHLDPPELGPLQVRVALNQEQASVSFVAQHAGVREALDQNAFRLREMLDSEGLDLVDVDVSDQSFAEQDSEASGGEGNGDERLPEADEQPEVAPMRLSLVDHFV